MKEGWKSYTLKEVAKIIGGSTPKTNIEEYWNGDFYWVTPAELHGDKYIDKTERTITDLAISKTNLELLPEGTVLLSSRAPIGKVCITKAPMYCNQGFKNVICGDSLYNEFVYYFLKHNTAYLNSLGTGATFKEISKKVVEQVEIPVPPLSEQQQIVEELDLLSGIIEKKKEQLKELDNLAQSIFYEMFGDPVANEKGWEVVKFSKICDLINGYAFPSNSFNDSNPLKAIKITNVGVNEFVEDDSSLPIDFSKMTNYMVNAGDIVLALTRTVISSGLKRAIVPSNYHKALVNQRVAALIPRQNLEKKFLYAYLGTEVVKTYVMEHAKALMQPNLSVGDLKNMPIYLPPLPLQQSFASKIEAIEKQKALIKQSITETETLFNSRMDYYFG